MKFQKVNIATARICGLLDAPYYFNHRCFYAMDIMFEESSCHDFYNLTTIKVGDTKEEGEVFCNKIKGNFKEANICEGDKVILIYGNDKNIIAIFAIGGNLYIDVKDKFTIKEF